MYIWKQAAALLEAAWLVEKPRSVEILQLTVWTLGFICFINDQVCHIYQLMSQAREELMETRTCARLCWLLLLCDWHSEALQSAPDTEKS